MISVYHILCTYLFHTVQKGKVSGILKNVRTDRTRHFIAEILKQRLNTHCVFTNKRALTIEALDIIQ